MTVIDVLVGNHIKRHREINAMSQRELARHIAVHPKTLEGFEAGHRRPSPVQLFQIAEVLGIEVERFFGQEAVTPTPNIFGETVGQVIGHYDSLSKQHRSAIFSFLSTPGRDPD